MGTNGMRVLEIFQEVLRRTIQHAGNCCRRQPEGSRPQLLRVVFSV